MLIELVRPKLVNKNIEFCFVKRIDWKEWNLSLLISRRSRTHRWRWLWFPRCFLYEKETVREITGSSSERSGWLLVYRG